MADEQFYSGSLFMLYIRNAGAWKPVACLTSNGISESWDFAETVTKCDPGVTRRKPTTYSYEIPFEGVFTDTSGAGGDTAKASWDTIKNIARAKTLTEYQIALLRDNGTEEPNFAPLSDLTKLHIFLVHSLTALICYKQEFLNRQLLN